MPLSTNQDYVTLLMSRLGRRTATNIRSTVVDELNVARVQIEANPFLPFFLEQEATVGLPAGARSINLPTGFIREIEEAEPRVVADDDATETRVFKRTIETIEYLDLNATETGAPRRYAISQGKIWVYPTTDKAYTLHFPCYIQTSEITDTSGLNPWFTYAPNYLMGLAGAAVAGMHMQNPRLEKQMLDLAAGALRTLVNFHEARENTNVDFSSSDLIADVSERIP